MLAFALLAPLAALLGSRLGGSDAGVAVPEDVAALIDQATTTAPGEVTVAVDDVPPTTLVVSDGPAEVTPAPEVAVTVPPAVEQASVGPPVVTTRAPVATTRAATTTPTRATTTTTTKAPATTTKAPATTTKAPATTRPPVTTTKPPATTAAARAYSPAELEAMVRAAFSADPDTAVQIVQRESGFNPGAHNGGCCYGLFQINWTSHRSWLSGIGVTRPDHLYDAALNIKAATLVYLRAGGWGPWQ